MKSPHARLSVFLLLAAVLATVVIGLIPSRHTLKENDDLFDYQWRQIAVSLREQDVVDQPVYELDGST